MLRMEGYLRTLGYLGRFLVFLALLAFFSMFASWIKSLDLQILLLLSILATIVLLGRIVYLLWRGLVPTFTERMILSVEGDRLLISWRRYRIPIERAQLCAVRWVSHDDPDENSLDGVLYLEVADSSDLSRFQRAYQDARVAVKNPSRRLRIALPSSAEGFDDVTAWLEDFPGLKREVVPGL